MRLTLRTLLAYLDNTLDPADATALREKLAESGFATQLVSRIRASLVDSKLSAPSPNAVNPIEEANVISEYLDSTLAAAQVAEFERACLESDPHLAEAAACHQVLTMVLGTPAKVSDELRQRIYSLPDRSVDQIASSGVSGSFSGIAVPDAQTLTGIPDSELPAEPVLQAAHGKVQPVGLGDSGVSDAPARLRDSGSLDDPAIAGSSPRDVDRSDLYGGNVRSSRVVPWLVSLALAGVLLFALSKIFAPLISPTKTAQDDRIQSFPGELEDYTVESFSPSKVDKPEIEVSAADAPPMEVVGTPGVDIQPSTAGDTEEGLVLPGPKAGEELPAPSALPEPVPTEPVPTEPVPVVPTADNMPAAEVVTNDLPGTRTESTPGLNMAMFPGPAAPTKPNVDGQAELAAAGPMNAASGKITDGSDSELPTPPADPTVAIDAPPMDDTAAGDAPPADPSVDPNAPPVDPNAADETLDQTALATAKSSQTLVMARAPDGSWKAIKQDMMVNQLASLVNAPKFRSEFAVADKLSATLVGATGANFIPAGDDARASGLKLDYGRALVKANQADMTFQVNLAGNVVDVNLPEKGNAIAVELIHVRRPGHDPFLDKSHVPIGRVIAVSGEVTVTSAGVDHAVAGDNQWFFRGEDDPKVLEVPEMPLWVDPNQDDSVLDESAREGLLAFLDQEQSLTLSLRDATSFRKAEVAALAAQVMLLMGTSDVYFGTDGILSKPKQRTYFNDHYRALLASVNRNVESAKSLRAEISKMDAANQKAAFRLLTGFSTNQLVEGGDEQLVEMLDSNSMAVRILATENLREITGTTLNFRPEEPSSDRRAATIKKWQVRQRKGDIKRGADK